MDRCPSNILTHIPICKKCCNFIYSKSLPNLGDKILVGSKRKHLDLTIFSPFFPLNQTPFYFSPSDFTSTKGNVMHVQAHRISEKELTKANIISVSHPQSTIIVWYDGIFWEHLGPVIFMSIFPSSFFFFFFLMV